MKSKNKILVVDDEEVNCLILKTNLELAGFVVDVANNAEDALSRDLTIYSLLILDVMMGNMSGFELTRLLRNRPSTAYIPIIICTAKDCEEDLLYGYNCGADDYVCKPFSIKELILRIRSVLRRTYGASGMINYDSLEVDTIKKRCYIGNEEVVLTKKEFGILSLLMQNPGVYFSRDEILKEIWAGDSEVLDRTVDVNINRLRRKLGPYEYHIITKQGYGYGFE